MRYSRSWVYVLTLAFSCIFLLPSGEARTEDISERLPDLTGYWVHKTVLPGTSSLPVLPDAETKMTSISRTKIVQREGKLSLRVQNCSVELVNSYDSIDVRLPSDFVEALPVQRRHGDIFERNGTVYFRSGFDSMVVGAELDGYQDKLPTEPSDPTVEDADMDGHPGVTVRVDGPVSGELYVVQRSRDKYRGRVLDKDVIEGKVDWSLKQNVLDSNHWLLGEGPSTEPETGRFRMVRLSESFSCEQIQHKQHQLLYPE